MVNSSLPRVWELLILHLGEMELELANPTASQESLLRETATIEKNTKSNIFLITRMFIIFSADTLKITWQKFKGSSW